MDTVTMYEMGLTVLLMICGFLFRNKIVFLLQLSWLIIIEGFNTKSADWLNNFSTFDYANIYNLKSSGMFMVFYNYLCVKAKYIGMDYMIFNFVLVLISTLMIAYVVLKVSNNPTIVLSLIMIYPFIDDIIQKRWYYAMSIMIFGIYLAFRENSLFKRTVILIITALFACQFHTGALLYLTLPIYMFLPRKIQNSVTIGIILIGTLFRNNISTIVDMLFDGGAPGMGANLVVKVHCEP